MSLNELMKSLRDTIFLSENNFGEKVEFHKGDGSLTLDVIVVWDADQLTGTNEVEGDGVVLERNAGRRIRESISIECSSEIPVNDRADPPDYFQRELPDDTIERVAVKRIMARDPGGMMLVRCIRVAAIHDRGRRRIG